MNDPTTTHKILVMCLPERHILNFLRRILLAAEADCPSTRVGTVGVLCHIRNHSINRDVLSAAINVESSRLSQVLAYEIQRR